jgi:hypothetical protein
MFVCLLDDDSVVNVDDIYCDYGNFKTGYLYDENGNKVIKKGLVVDILQVYDDWN